MCGICGIVSFNASAPVDKDLLIRMMQTMKHRGPDDQGVYSDGTVGLACRRLSIIDLIGGRQPIANEDESMWIVVSTVTSNLTRQNRALAQRLTILEWRLEQLHIGDSQW